MKMNRSQSIVLKKTSSKHERISYIAYEAIGTFILCYAFNLHHDPSTAGFIQKDAITTTLFIVELIAWDVSAAHFNLGVTVAYLIYDADRFR